MRVKISTTSTPTRSTIRTVQRMYTRVAVIGDVAGLVHQLRSCLEGLGVTEETWPEGLHVIQLGDLFGGNDDLACAELVEPHLLAGRWTQLIGNWELAAVGGPRISRGGVTAQVDALHLFSNWCGEGLVEYATVVRPDRGPPALVTHAGLTVEWWVAHLDGDENADSVAARINAAPPQYVHFGGEMAGDDTAPPSPVWASTRELWTSWSHRTMPWSQIHGHTTPYDPGCGWSPWAPFDLLDQCVVDQLSFHTVFRPLRARPGCVVYGIDQGLWPGSPPGALSALTMQVTRPLGARRS